MLGDVRDLLEGIGLPRFPFRELTWSERARKARARLSRARFTPALAPPGPPERRGPDEPRPWGFTVALVALRPGTGRTTLCELIPEVLQAAGRTALSVELCPSSRPSGEAGGEPGWAQDGTRSIARMLASGACRLPLGNLGPDELERVEECAAKDPEWLAAHLCALEAARADLVLLEPPPGESPLLVQALSCADEALALLSPDLEGWASAPLLASLVERHLRGGRSRATFVINRFDARRSLDREIRAALEDLALSPFSLRIVQLDLAVEQARSHGQSLFVEAADSQAAGDVQALAEWLLWRRQQSSGTGAWPIPDARERCECPKLDSLA